MKITIDDAILEKYKIRIAECLYWFLYAKRCDIKEIEKELIDNGLAEIKEGEFSAITEGKEDLLVSVLLQQSVTIDEKWFYDVADALRAVFPDGKKPGTAYYWKDSTAIVAQKLKTLKSKYVFNFTKEQAVRAAKKYIESFNGDYTYMQLLKYFILKKDPSTGELRSDFMSYITNEGQEDLDNNLWQTHLV